MVQYALSSPTVRLPPINMLVPTSVLMVGTALVPSFSVPRTRVSFMQVAARRISNLGVAVLLAEARCLVALQNETHIGL